MTIAIKLFAFISAVYVAYFDFSKIQIMLENGSTDVTVSLISYFFIPVGILTAVYYLTGFLESKSFKKISAVTLTAFAGIHILLKLADIILNVFAGTLKNTDLDTNYQCFMWVSQILLLVSVFVLGLSYFIKKIQPLAAYILILGVVAYFLTYAYYIYAGGYTINALFSESPVSFILTECLVPIGYVGIFLKEIWLDNEIL